MAETTTRKRMPRLAALTVSAVGHVLGALLIFVLFGSAFMNESVFGLVKTGLGDVQMQGYILRDLAFVAGLSVCMWAFLFIAYLWVKAGMARRRKMVVASVRGTVVTETLVVLPVFLLLSFGLAQMGINSMAGLLTTLGTFQAARTLAVWGPEVGNNRTGTTVSANMARDRARIAAAGVIAPVAPMSAGNIACQKSDSFNKLVSGMVAAGLAPVETPERYATFSDALDTAKFAQRGPAKFAGAYCSVSVSYSGDMRTSPDETDVGEFEATVNYDHKMVFPLVGIAFGGTLTPGGWKTRMTRTYRLTHHLTPNPELPKKNDIL